MIPEAEVAMDEAHSSENPWTLDQGAGMTTSHWEQFSSRTEKNRCLPDWPSADWQTSLGLEKVMENSTPYRFPKDVFLHLLKKMIFGLHK
ncbi:jg24027 [Pararge aegeria aegeria]|uniref:Jg24027 protein n=1 Tax=Pararge aegeria aegeria TaxID=348720 RepID=A0A8S4RB62_9NEOP|nr:jg24027 [Pararge aegeria aegeria]